MGEHGIIVILTWPEMVRRVGRGEPAGYIWSISKNCVVGETGIHMGVGYNGIVYCNIHPEGMLGDVWNRDFDTMWGLPLANYIYF